MTQNLEVLLGIGMKALLGWRTPGEMASTGHSLEKHPFGAQLRWRDTHQRLRELGDGSGFGRGRQSGLVRVPVALQGAGGLDDAESDRSSPLLDVMCRRCDCGSQCP